jgi:tetratricopeptide (TPR) repeat protein
VAEAIQFIEEALRLDQESGYGQGEAEDWGNLGILYLEAGELEQAADAHRAALEADRASGDRQSEAIDLSNLAAVTRVQGQLSESLRLSQEALRIVEPLHNPDVESNLLTGRGATYEALEDWENARTDYEHAIRHLETVRVRLIEETHRISMMGVEQINLYQRLALLLFRHFKKMHTVWQVAERARSRALLEQLGQTQIRAHTVSDSNLGNDEGRLLNKIRLLASLLRQNQVTPQQRAETVRTLRESYEELDALWQTMVSTSPDHVAMRRGDVVSYGFLREMLGSMR